jgi:hypothetical protein
MTTIVEGTGKAGSKWIKTSYPEIEAEEIALNPEESLISNVMKEGLNV